MNSTFTPGRSSLIRSAASLPSICGITTSVRTTSMFSAAFAATWIASRPLAAVITR
jgi:hypothetical protein